MAGPEKEYTINPDQLQAFIESIDTKELSDAQKCGHILTFFLQKGIIKTVSFRPEDQYIRDKNASTTGGGGSIDFSGQERKGGS